MFTLMWGPTVAAVSVVLDHADNPVIVSTALTGLMHAARIAAYHHVDEVRTPPPCATAAMSWGRAPPLHSNGVTGACQDAVIWYAVGVRAMALPRLR